MADTRNEAEARIAYEQPTETVKNAGKLLRWVEVVDTLEAIGGP
jgi:hypothetical protein